MTVEDFCHAKSLLEADVDIFLPEPVTKHPGSEFGDTDSLLSIHWDDEDDLNRVPV